MRKLFTILSFITLVCSISGQNSIPMELAEKYYNDVKLICEKDNGKLWGISIYSPTLFIDPQTRDIVSNESDNENLLTKENNLYVGKFPQDKIIANSTTRFGEKDFTMVMFPLSKDEYVRNVLIVHEMFHYCQPKLGLDKASYNNHHADDILARIYLKLEWNALEKALLETDPQLFKEYIKDALTFRIYRRSIFENAEINENLFEINEGLAEYTGHKLCATSEESLKQQLLLAKKNIWSKKSYIRSFGYFSGLMYACLLDKTNAEWRPGIKYDDDLGRLLQKKLEIQSVTNLFEAQNEIKDKYDFKSISEYETKQKDEKDKLLAYYKNIFTEKPILTITLIDPNYGFNPNHVESLGELGTVYPSIKLTDKWGTLTVDQSGCLMSNDWKLATVSAEGIKTEENIIKTISWTLELNKEYILERNGTNYTITKK